MGKKLKLLAERVAAEERKDGLACDVIELRAVEVKRG